MARFTGGDDMAARIQGLIDGLPDRFAKALYQEAEVEATECKKRCPVDTGALRSSIHVEGPHRQGRRIWCEIVAGGPAAPYALEVHEDLDAHHTNGQAKYIESTLAESAPHLADRVGKRIGAAE